MDEHVLYAFWMFVANSKWVCLFWSISGKNIAYNHNTRREQSLSLLKLWTSCRTLWVYFSEIWNNEIKSNWSKLRKWKKINYHLRKLITMQLVLKKCIEMIMWNSTHNRSSFCTLRKNIRKIATEPRIKFVQRT